MNNGQRKSKNQKAVSKVFLKEYRFANNSCRRDWRSLFNNRKISKKWKGQLSSNRLFFFVVKDKTSNCMPKIENFLENSYCSDIVIESEKF